VETIVTLQAQPLEQQTEVEAVAVEQILVQVKMAPTEAQEYV
jgi:hypothetical protein